MSVSAMQYHHVSASNDNGGLLSLLLTATAESGWPTVWKPAGVTAKKENESAESRQLLRKPYHGAAACRRAGSARKHWQQQQPYRP